MANVEKRQTASGPRYDVRYRDPRRKPRKKTFRRKLDADRFAREVETDIRRGEWIDPRRGRGTFEDWWASWAEQRVDLRPSTRDRDWSYARAHLLPTFGAVRLADIDHATVQTWVASLAAQGLAPSTVVKARQILSKSLAGAVKAGMIRANPAQAVEVPRVERDETRFLTPPEVATLADTIEDRYRALVLVGAYCGLRLGEMAALRRDRVDLLARRLEVVETLSESGGKLRSGPPKTDASRRTVPLPRHVAEALEAHTAGMPRDALVFTAAEGGPLRGSLFRPRVWQPACVAAGVGEMIEDPQTGRRRYVGPRLHDLRHTAVAFWIAAGATPLEVAKRAGHRSVVTVFDRYGHLLPGAEDRLTDALDDLAASARPAPDATVRAISAP
jgi:integrase